MLALVGLIAVFVLVFGGYVLSGGKIEIVMEALPHEFPMLMGASIGSYLISNKAVVLKKSFKEIAVAFKGPKWNKKDYQDLLCLLYTLCKVMKSKGLIAVEQHVENPTQSNIFQLYPRILRDHFVMDLICDTLRTLTMGMENPQQIEENIDRQIERHHHEASACGHALQGMADGLPAIGIVVAVLGVIKTMASINEPPEILGRMIGGALVGTFMGVFMSYCIVGPIAFNNLASHTEEQQFYFIIRDVLVAHLKGMAPQVSMEMGRTQVPTHYQPTFLEMEEATANVKIEG